MTVRGIDDGDDESPASGHPIELPDGRVVECSTMGSSYDDAATYLAARFKEPADA